VKIIIKHIYGLCKCLILTAAVLAMAGTGCSSGDSTALVAPYNFTIRKVISNSQDTAIPYLVTLNFETVVTGADPKK